MKEKKIKEESITEGDIVVFDFITGRTNRGRYVGRVLNGGDIAHLEEDDTMTHKEDSDVQKKVGLTYEKHNKIISDKYIEKQKLGDLMKNAKKQVYSAKYIGYLKAELKKLIDKK